MVVPIGLEQHRTAHVYRRPGRYTVTIVVTDRAGNVARFAVRVKILKPPKPKPKPKPQPKGHLR